jgi:hypothetical protein
VLRRIFGHRREDAPGRWRELHNDKLHNLYSPSNNRIIKTRKRRAENVAHMGRMRKSYKILTGKPEGKTSRHR